MSTVDACVSTSIQPLDDRVLVMVDNPEEVSPGGIVLPSNAHEMPDRATIVACGPMVEVAKLAKMNELYGEDRHDYAPVLEAGVRVIIAKYGGFDVEEGENKFKLLREDDIIAVID